MIKEVNQYTKLSTLHTICQLHYEIPKLNECNAEKSHEL